MAAIHSLKLIGGKRFESWCRNGWQLIWRFTPRGQLRLRLDTTRSSRISSNTVITSHARVLYAAIGTPKNKKTSTGKPVEVIIPSLESRRTFKANFIAQFLGYYNLLDSIVNPI
jgi:hypothetical protein